MKIAFLTSLDPHDRRAWSGTLYFMGQALQQYCGEVTFIGPLSAPLEMIQGKIIHRIIKFFTGKSYLYFHGKFVARRYAKIAARRLAAQQFDVLIAPTGAPEIAYLQTKLPIVLIEDATYTNLHNYYPIFSNLAPISSSELDTIEQRATAKATVLAYSSQWAAASALQDYHADPAKVHVIPFGANLEKIPDREQALARKLHQRCRLLFIGVDWPRKGGDIALETLQALEDMGIPTELTICGCIPPTSVSHLPVTVIPFLDKNDPQQSKQLDELYIAHDFLIVPTRYECYGLVYAEASAFGLPSLASNTGGIAGVVTHAENGFLLPLEARGEAYARIIAELYRNEEQYASLVRSTRSTFEQRLNWEAWTISLKEALAERVNGYNKISPEHQTSNNVSL